MKRFVAIFASLMFILLSIATYKMYEIDRYNTLLKATNSYFYNFEIPKYLFNDNPKHLELLKKAANENDVNFIRVVSYYNNTNKQSYTDNFIYLSNETRLFKTIPIKKGEILTSGNINKLDSFISTKDTKNENQIAVIKNFGGKHNYSIYTIDKLLESNTYPGRYKAECLTQEQFDNFINSYISYITKDSSVTYDNPDEFIASIEENTNITTESSSDIFIIFSFCMLILLLTFIFYLISQTKAISIMKLNGYTNKEIKNNILNLLYIKVFIVTNSLLIIASLAIYDNSIEFLFEFIVKNLIAFMLSFLILEIVCSTYIKYIKITYCIKGKKPLNIIIVVNLIFKMVVSVIVIVIGSNLLVNLHDISMKKENLNNWKTASNYGVFYPILTGDDTDKLRAGEDVLDVPSYNLYSYLDIVVKAIYVKSDQYSINNMSSTSNSSGYIRSMRVNTNYLDEYPIYSESGEKVSVSNNNTSTIYLIPEKYKENEQEFKEYFQKERKDFHNIHTDYYGQMAKPDIEKIDFIYTKSNQKVFSFNTEVFPENNNVIIDPIIQVMTEGNILVPDTFYTSTSKQTLFIPLKNMDTKLTYSHIENELKKNFLNDNFPHIVKINDVILENINNIEKEIIIIRTMLVIIIVILFVTLVQFIYLLFQKNKFELFLKKSFGYSFMQKYKVMYSILGFTNIIELIICMMFSIESIIFLFLYKIILEVVLISGLIIYFEEFNVIKVLKEGI